MLLLYITAGFFFSILKKKTDLFNIFLWPVEILNLMIIKRGFK